MHGPNEPQVGYIPHCRPMSAGRSWSGTARTRQDEHAAGKASAMGQDPRDQVLWPGSQGRGESKEGDYFVACANSRSIPGVPQQKCTGRRPGSCSSARRQQGPITAAEPTPSTDLERACCLYRSCLPIAILELKSQMCSQTHAERQRRTLGQKPSAVHLHDSADEDVVALMVNSVSHQDFVHHWNENLVLLEEREEIRKVTLQRGRQRDITPASYS